MADRLAACLADEMAGQMAGVTVASSAVLKEHNLVVGSVEP
jgi:hypothetical protein